MKPENVEMIKRFLMLILLSALFTIVVIMFNGCMSKPDIKDYPNEMTPIEKKLQYKYDNCVYAQSFNKKVDLRCYEILKDNQKIEAILNYNYLKDSKKLPILYRPSGSDAMTFDDFFKYMK